MRLTGQDRRVSSFFAYDPVATVLLRTQCGIDPYGEGTVGNASLNYYSKAVIDAAYKTLGLVQEAAGGSGTSDGFLALSGLDLDVQPKSIKSKAGQDLHSLYDNWGLRDAQGDRLYDHCESNQPHPFSHFITEGGSHLMEAARAMRFDQGLFVEALEELQTQYGPEEAAAWRMYTQHQPEATIGDSDNDPDMTNPAGDTDSDGTGSVTTVVPYL